MSGHMPEAGFNVGSGRRPDSAPALTGTAGWRETEADVTVTSQGPDPVVGLRVTRKGLGARHLWRWGGHEGSPLSGRQARGSGLSSEALTLQNTEQPGRHAVRSVGRAWARVARGLT